MAVPSYNQTVPQALYREHIASLIMFRRQDHSNRPTEQYVIRLRLSRHKEAKQHLFCFFQNINMGAGQSGEEQLFNASSINNDSRKRRTFNGFPTEPFKTSHRPLSRLAGPAPDRDGLLRQNTELRQHLRTISLQAEFDAAFSSHKMKLMCISCLFKQAKYRLVETLDKILRASFFDSSSDSITPLIESVRDMQQSLAGWLSSFEEEITSLDDRSDATENEIQTLKDFVWTDCNKALEDLLSQLFELKVVRDEVTMLKSRYQAMRSAVDNLRSTENHVSSSRDECLEEWELLRAELLGLQSQVNSGSQVLNDQLEREKSFSDKLKDIRRHLEAHSTTLEVIFDALTNMSEQIEDAEAQLHRPEFLGDGKEIRDRMSRLAIHLDRSLDFKIANVEASNITLSVGRKDEEASQLLSNLLDSQTDLTPHVQSITSTITSITSHIMEERQQKLKASIGSWFSTITNARGELEAARGTAAEFHCHVHGMSRRLSDLSLQRRQTLMMSHVPSFNDLFEEKESICQEETDVEEVCPEPFSAPQVVLPVNNVVADLGHEIVVKRSPKKSATLRSPATRVGGGYAVEEKGQVEGNKGHRKSMQPNWKPSSDNVRQNSPSQSPIKKVFSPARVNVTPSKNGSPIKKEQQKNLRQGTSRALLF
ncbi:centrosomal protein [Planoprotostelium fungivorum]|uniref:Centrosomal protein n=1 Tax=Planoprotostelium fungivorum TaxID=1890364 RepID=A0A2P6P0Y3_9EUKA|nr:centrosomal protein [Planoprotostelium fungivorum]